MGTATAHMALGAPEATVVGIDRDFHTAAERVVAPFSNIVLVGGDTTSDETFGRVEAVLDEDEVGILFIDSTHDGDTPMREFDIYSGLFANECLVVCDDLLGPDHLKEKMQRFWEWLPGEKMELHDLHPYPNDDYDNPGFGVSICQI